PLLWLHHTSRFRSPTAQAAEGRRDRCSDVLRSDFPSEWARQVIQDTEYTRRRGCAERGDSVTASSVLWFSAPVIHPRRELYWARASAYPCSPVWHGRVRGPVHPATGPLLDNACEAMPASRGETSTQVHERSV